MIKTGIYHEKVAAEDNRYGIDDLNAKHKSFNLLGYELVEEANLPAGTPSHTFFNLDGDSDEQYFIEFFLDYSADGDRQLYIQLNGLNTGYTGVRTMDEQGGRYGVNVSDGFQICRNTWIQSGTFQGSGTIRVKSGMPRYACFYSFWLSSDSSYYGKQDFQGVLRDTSVNITSLSIFPTGGTISGLVRLYKKIPLE